MNDEQNPSKTSLRGWRLHLAWVVALLALTGMLVPCLFYFFFASDPRDGMHWPLGVIVLGGAIFYLVAFVRWCCRSSQFNKFLFVVACFVTVLALLRAEENWRAKRAWDSFKHAQQALGIAFDMPSLAPVLVPDDQNFALTPTVASSYLCYMDRQGHPFHDTNVVNLMQLFTDNSKSLEQPLGSWEKSEISNLESLQKYYLGSKTNLSVQMRRSAPTDVLLALSKYDSRLESLRKDSQLTYSRFPLAYDFPEPASIMLPHLAGLKRSVQALKQRSIAELQNGQSAKALDDVVLGLRLGDASRAEPCLISHLVRFACVGFTLQPMYEGLAQRAWNETQLAALDQELLKLDYLAAYHTATRGEIALVCGTLEFRHQTRQPLEPVMDFPANPDRGAKNLIFSMPQLLSPILIPDSFFYRSQLTIAQTQVRWILPMVDEQRRVVPPRLSDLSGLYKELKEPSPYNYIASLLVPAVGKAARTAAIAQNGVDMARIAIALERYRLARGEYPQGLEALAPQFLASIPHDVIDGEPLKYRREVDGRFTLYSVGWNQVDDGGVVALADGKTGPVNKNEGDWVWRYPAK